jgi:hypothetical protein
MSGAQEDHTSLNVPPGKYAGLWKKNKYSDVLIRLTSSASPPAAHNATSESSSAESRFARVFDLRMHDAYTNDLALQTRCAENFLHTRLF